MSFTEKKITAIFSMKGKNFANGSNELTLSGLRMTATIESVGIHEMGACNLRIWGMKPEDMNTLATMSIRRGEHWNGLTLLAGDSSKGMAQVFAGTIYDSFTDYNSLPDVAFCVDASPGWAEKMTPAAANSYRGTVNAAVILQALASAAGFTFINNGVTVQLTNHYLYGTLVDQINDVVRAAGIGCRLSNNTLEIFPSGGFTHEDPIKLSRDTGLIGYPAFDPQGLAVTSVFNPDLAYGRRVTMISDIPQACGDFNISTCLHSISCLVPGGPWFTSMRIWNDTVPRVY